LILIAAAALLVCSTAAGAQFTAYQEPADKAFDEMLRDIDGPGSSASPAPTVPAAPAIMPAPAPAVRHAVPRFDPSLAMAMENFASRFWNGRVDELKAAMWRLDRMRPAIERILAEEGVPARFAAVVLVESGANAAALSPKSARGLWQLIPGTARRYGLAVGRRRDDRIDLRRATMAAARCLRDLHREFGDWRLALAAYNAGAGAIRSAIGRARSADFQVLSDRAFIPEETRNYVPAVLAAINLMALQTPATEAGLQPLRTEETVAN
jgi:soluble lytic murein transglycosylase-like protein